MGQKRRSFTAEQKATIVRRHLKDKVAVSDLADEHGVQPSQIHQWVNAVLGQAEQAFARQPGGKGRKSRAQLEDAKQRQIKRLEDKLQLKNEVISELMEENVKAKKENGDL